MVAARASWHAARRRCISASNVAPVLGVASPAGTAYDVWAYIAHGVGQDETPEMRWGRRMEPVILDWAAGEIGKPIERWPQDHLAGGAPDIWGATPDGLTDDPAPVEAKSWAWGGAWADGPPLCVVIQVQVQIYCLGATHGWVAAQVGGRPRLDRIERHDTLIRRARAECRRWWARYIEGGEMPPLDGRPQTARALAAIARPQIADRAIRLPPIADALRTEIETARGLARQSAEYATLRANQMRALLGRYAYGVTPEGGVVSHLGGQLRLPDRLPSGVGSPSPWRQH